MTSALPQQFDTFLECKREAATASKEGLTPLCWCDVVLAPLGGANLCPAHQRIRQNKGRFHEVTVHPYIRQVKRLGDGG
jgi:hypothetical protein